MDLSFFIAIFTNQDEPSLAGEFDKQPRGNTSLTHILARSSDPCGREKLRLQ